ncbi:RmlD substrate binding domain protein [Caprobacter fermentans]|uniref:dTDP-4-dehydrorhamnose reductase n=1 Tax=Caproicibacter fermentans TaxID=2576756 RepID=A0A6N8HYC3_9FIRM|nr:sugar nucleotide-binding protein [Caproicibacter fermentans]MVB10851.1 RmlD substrate binding domain protein [Caproicibacter fermentans]
MRVLIFGASGYAGRAIAQKLVGNHEVYGTYYSQAKQYSDNKKMLRYKLNDTDIAKSILDCVRPQIIISCLRGDFQLQLAAHKQIADYLLRAKDGKIIYISTANVFDASKEKPHYEFDKTESETDYGNFKIKCEQMLQDKLGDRCTIIRIPQIWGKDCPRILKLIEDTKSNTPIMTYPNVYVNYTTNIQIADWIDYIIKKELEGIFHIGTRDTCDYMQFQLELSKVLGLNEPVFNKEIIQQKCFQAVLPGRKEIPNDFHLNVMDVLAYLRKVQNSCHDTLNRVGGAHIT